MRAWLPMITGIGEQVRAWTDEIGEGALRWRGIPVLVSYPSADTAVRLRLHAARRCAVGVVPRTRLKATLNAKAFA